MAGYDPKRPRPTQGADLGGLPGDAAPPPALVSAQPIHDPDPDPTPEPTRRALPRPSPPLDRRLPPAVMAGGAVTLVAVFLLWRRMGRSS